MTGIKCFRLQPEWQVGWCLTASSTPMSACVFMHDFTLHIYALNHLALEMPFRVHFSPWWSEPQAGLAHNRLWVFRHTASFSTHHICQNTISMPTMSRVLSSFDSNIAGIQCIGSLLLGVANPLQRFVAGPPLSTEVPNSILQEPFLSPRSVCVPASLNTYLLKISPLLSE